MTNQQVVDVILSVLYITVEVSLPLLGVAMIIGLLVSIFQAATQINESTLSFLPKIAAMIFVLIVSMMIHDLFMNILSEPFG